MARQVRPNAIRIKELRAERGLTQQELAEGADISKKTVENVEAGKHVLIHTLDALAVCLNVTVDEIIIHDGDDRDVSPLRAIAPIDSSLTGSSGEQVRPFISGQEQISPTLAPLASERQTLWKSRGIRVWSRIALGVILLSISVLLIVFGYQIFPSSRVTVHVFNCDDECAFAVNGRELFRVGFGQDPGWRDITGSLVEGTNELKVNVLNHGGAITYGFEVRKGRKRLTQQICGQVYIIGCNDNQSVREGVAQELSYVMRWEFTDRIK